VTLRELTRADRAIVEPWFRDPPTRQWLGDPQAGDHARLGSRLAP
jgi:hypothetical protein